MRSAERAAAEIAAEHAQCRGRQRGAEQQAEQGAERAVQGRFGEQQPLDLAARQPDHAQEGELRASRRHALRLQRVDQERPGEERDEGQHVEVDAIGARQVRYARAGLVGELGEHARRQLPRGGEGAGVRAAAQLQVDAREPSEAVEPPLREPEVHRGGDAAAAGPGQAADDGQRLGARADLHDQLLARRELPLREGGGRQEQAVVEQREARLAATALVRRLVYFSEPGRAEAAAAQRVDAGDREVAAAQPRRLEDCDVDLEHRAGQRHLRVGRDAREHRLVEALARPDDAGIRLPGDLAHGGGELRERRRVDQVHGVAECHAEGDRADLHERAQGMAQHVAAEDVEEEPAHQGGRVAVRKLTSGSFRDGAVEPLHQFDACIQHIYSVRESLPVRPTQGRRESWTCSVAAKSD